MGLRRFFIGELEMKKPVPGFSSDVKPGKIDVPSGGKQGMKSQQPVGSPNKGMPKGGLKPTKV